MCGAEVATPYCARCGERRASDRTYSLWEFIREHVIESVISFDGRVIRTVKMLLAQPGELTRAFMRGARLPYLAPLQLFFLMNVGFFLWSAATGSRIFDTPLSVHVGGMPYSPKAKEMVSAQLAAKQVDPKVYAARFNAIGSAQARSLIVAMVPAFALLVGIATVRRKRAPMVQHVVYSLHFYAFVFVMLVASRYLIDLPLVALLQALHVDPGPFEYDSQRSLASFIVISIYIAVSLRRAYDLGRLRSIVSAPFLGYGMYMILQAYRGLVFFVTYYSM